MVFPVPSIHEQNVVIYPRKNHNIASARRSWCSGGYLLRMMGFSSLSGCSGSAVHGADSKIHERRCDFQLQIITSHVNPSFSMVEHLVGIEIHGSILHGKSRCGS
jgi:hypothetical protein